MRNSVRLSNSVHLISLIALNPFGDLTSKRLAKSINTNPSYVRKIMSQLKKANILTSVTGHAEPKLTKSPDEITLYDIYKAVDNSKLLNIDTAINPTCGPGQNIQLTLEEYYDQIQKNVEKQMKKIRLSDILHKYEERLAKYPKFKNFGN